MNCLLIAGLSVEGFGAWTGAFLTAAGSAYILGLNHYQKLREIRRAERIHDLESDLAMERLRNDAQGRCPFPAAECRSVRDELAALKRPGGGP